MAGDSRTPCIVVGYDGSPSARAALALGIDSVRDGKLFVVHAYEAPGDFWGSEHYQELLDLALERGRAVLDGLVDAEPRLTTIDYETELIAGRPAEVVAGVADARDADSIIIGTRGFGRVQAVLGSVPHELLHEAACPVTVIPEAALRRADGAEPLQAGISER